VAGIMDLMTYGDPVDKLADTKFFLGTKGKFDPITLYEMPRSYQEGSAAMGDIDGDGDLDAVIAGDVAVFQSRVLVYKNNAVEGWTVKNIPPSAPTGLKAVVSNNKVTISWNAATDDLSPVNSLTYNVMLVRNDTVVVSPNSTAGGRRQIYQAGNAGHGLKYSLQGLKAGDYTVAVQAVDNGYAGSAFTTPVEFAAGENIMATEADLESSVQLFPNPVENKLKIVSALDDVVDVHIYDLVGNLVLTSTEIYAGSITMDLTSLDAWVYIVGVTTNMGTVFRRVFKG